MKKNSSGRKNISLLILRYTGLILMVAGILTGWIRSDRQAFQVVWELFIPGFVIYGIFLSLRRRSPR